MDMLFKRSQAASVFRRITFGLWGRVTFRLWSKVEFDDEEKALIERYRFDKAMLINAVQPGLRRKAFFVGVFWTLLLSFYFLNARSSIYYMTLGYAAYYIMEALYFFDLYRTAMW